MRFLILGRSVGLIKKTLKKKNHKHSRNRRPGTLAAWKTTRREPKINMAEKMVDVVAKLRQRGKKDQPPKLLCDIKWLKNVVTNFFFFFFWKMPKILVGRTTRNGEKKGDGLMYVFSFLSGKRAD